MSFSSRAVVSSLSAIAACLLPLAASAQAPQLINYQGRLLNGTNLVNGIVGLSLRLFNVPSGGAAQYEDSNTVTVADGLYSTFIGDNPTEAAFLSALTNPAVWVEVAVNGVALSPRERLASVGYSLATRGISVSAANNTFVLNPAQNSVDTTGNNSTLGGGGGNSIRLYAYYSFLGGGIGNSIQDASFYSFLGGGNGNSIQGGAGWSFLGGGNGNVIQESAGTSVLGGGSGNSIQTNAYLSFLGGGSQNTIQTDAESSVLGGGSQNSIQTFAYRTFLGGGAQNSIQADGFYSFLGGGIGNNIGAGASESFLGGGIVNSVGAGASGSSLGGGGYNNIHSNADFSFLGGGRANSVAGPYGVVPGGRDNSAGSYSFAAGRRAKATNDGSFVWADSQNADFGTTSSNQLLIRASGGVGIGTTSPANQLSVAGQADFSGRVGVGTATPGQNLTVATSTSDTNATAKLGLYAWGGHLWMLQSVSGFDTNATVTAATPAGSLQVVDLTLTTNNTVMTLAPDGRVGIGITNPTNRLDVAGSVGATVFNTTSDRNAKQDIAPVDAAAILEKISALPVASWSFKTEPDVKHIGPMAQDFRAAFGLGPNDTSIATVDADGVALAAIQALNSEVTRLRADATAWQGGQRSEVSKISRLEAENVALKAQLDEVLERLRTLETGK